MMAQNGLHYAYTDAPEPHPNLFLGSLQLLFWLLFRPSAWRYHVARIDPSLRPDFCLGELQRAQWLHPAMRRLLVQGYVVLPALSGVLIALILVAGGVSGEAMARGVAGGVALGVTYGVALGVVGGVALGVVGGVTYGVVLGVALGVTYGVALGVVGSVALGVAGGVAGGVVLGVLVSLISRQTAYSMARRIGGVIIGILMGIVVVSVVVSVARAVARGVADDVVLGVALSVVGGVALGVALGLRTRRWKYGITLGAAGGVALVVAVGVALGVAVGVAGGVAGGVVLGALSSGMTILPYALGERIAGSWAGIIAGILGHIGLWSLATASQKSSPSAWLTFPLITVSALCGLTHTWWRPVVFYPFLLAWHTLLYRADEWRIGDRPSLLRWHAAFWDEHQRLPWFGLDEHVVLVAERHPQEAQAALDYLSTSRQRWAAEAAQIEVDARQLERCADIAALSTSHRSLSAGELEGPASALLRSFSRISQDIDSALRQESSYNQRLALSAVEDRLDGLLRELTRSSERYAVRFHPVATRWRQIVAHHVQHLSREVELRQEIDSPYIVGVPLTAQQAIFAGRTDISARIEHLLLDQRRPPVLLYGPRRMGKTSLLNNLGRLLPSTIVPLFVDLQGPASLASDHTGLLYNLARDMVNSAQQQRNLPLPPLTRDMLEKDPFTRFDEWLDEVEHIIGSDTILLALDEFEVLDRALTEERFSETMVLGMLRHLIQHRPRFKVLLAGSHTLDEVQRWASYLINVQVVHLSYLSADEARQLIEHPIKDFALRYEPAASQRVLALTRGHPALVQLLCAEIVALKNEQSPEVRRLARLADVEAAVPEALSHGMLFFADITRNQVDGAGLALLRFVAAQGEGAVVNRATLAQQCPAALEATLALLTRRELIEAVDGGYRLQVELIRRWFSQEDIPG
jgi:hypothetical protein